jgi:hypothetical protein
LIDAVDEEIGITRHHELQGGAFEVYFVDEVTITKEVFEMVEKVVICKRYVGQVRILWQSFVSKLV